MDENRHTDFNMWVFDLSSSSRPLLQIVGGWERGRKRETFLLAMAALGGSVW